MNNPKYTHLSLSWSVSRGKDTYGYNICRLDDSNTGKRFKCSGGGYDMVGTVFAQWLMDTYPIELCGLNIHANHFVSKTEGSVSNPNGKYYAARYYVDENRMYIDGACGLDSILEIAKAIGLDVQREYIKKGRRRGETTGWFVEAI
jgi:hypothetical protein